MVKLRSSAVRSVLVAGAVSFVAIGANAADIYHAPEGGYKDGPAAVSWAGVYAGLNGGYGYDVNNQLSNTIVAPEGVFGGGQIGYNWQRGSLVLGLETDIQASDISDTYKTSFTSTSSALNYFGTVRGRLGFAFENALFYGTAGLAYGEVENKFIDFTCSCNNGGSKQTQTGFVVGGGVEYKLAPDWSINGEYQYIDLTADEFNMTALGFGSNSDRSQVSTFRVGVNWFPALSAYQPLK